MIDTPQTSFLPTLVVERDELTEMLKDAFEKGRAAGVQQEWRPFETAPKDGRHFLAATKFLGITCVEAIWWDRGWLGAQGEQRFDAWMPLPNPPSAAALRTPPGETK